MKRDIFQDHYDAAKWGVSDFYADCAEALQSALRSGKPFDTGWYGVKKETQSGRVSYKGGDTIRCEVSCTDDFDDDFEVYGYGVVEVRVGAALEVSYQNICDALDVAAQDAEEDRQNIVPGKWVTP